MQAKWIIGGGILAAIGGFCFFGYDLWQKSTDGLSTGREEVIAEIINGTEAFIDNLRTYGINIISGGGETADVGDLVKTAIFEGLEEIKAVCAFAGIGEIAINAMVKAANFLRIEP